MLIYHMLYQLFLFICSSLRFASSATAFNFSAFSSLAFLSLYNFSPCSANAIPRCSSLRRLSHHVYWPTAPARNAATAILHDRSSLGMPGLQSNHLLLGVELSVPVKTKLVPPKAPPVPMPTSKESLAHGILCNLDMSPRNEPSPNLKASLQPTSFGLPPAVFTMPPGIVLTGSSLCSSFHIFPACVSG